MRTIGPAKFYQHATAIFNQIAEAVDSFTEAILPSHISTMFPLSQQERHRIWRAFWRLRLYFALYHDFRPQAQSNYQDDLSRHLNQLKWGPRVHRRASRYHSRAEHPRDQEEFFKKLTIWEIEEMDCVYHHIRYQSRSGLWRKACRKCDKMIMPDVGESNHDCRNANGPSNDLNLEEGEQKKIEARKGTEGKVDRNHRVNYLEASATFRKRKWQQVKSLWKPRDENTLDSPIDDKPSSIFWKLPPQSENQQRPLKIQPVYKDHEPI
ncbi:MAG: hypothetical protein Q9218_005946 [Villophora microphyllina]